MDPPLCTAHYAAFGRPLEVAVLLDRSCAMRARFDGATATGPTDPEGRWGAVAAALESAGLDTTVAAWSLAFSPEDPTMCAHSGELAIYPEPYSGELFPDLLSVAGETPFETCSADMSEAPIEATLGALNGSKEIGASGEPLLLVIAAGAPSCGATTTTLEDAAALTAYDMVVLALAPDATAAPLLQSLAIADEAGERPNYHEVASAAEVAPELEAILASRRSCAVDLFSDSDTSIENEEDLRVWIDGELVESDPDEGWLLTFDGAITLNGALCDRYRAGDIQRIEASLGCDEAVCVVVDPDEEGQGLESCDGLDNDCDELVDESCI